MPTIGWIKVELSKLMIAGVSVVDFDIKMLDDDERYQKLIASGYKSVYSFLEEYSPPTLDQIAQLKHIFRRITRRL